MNTGIRHRGIGDQNLVNHSLSRLFTLRKTIPRIHTDAINPDSDKSRKPYSINATVPVIPNPASVIITLIDPNVRLTFRRIIAIVNNSSPSNAIGNEKLGMG